MAHQHGHAHLVRRQRNKQEDDDPTEIVFVTMPNTYTGKVVWVTQQDATSAAKTLVPPAVATRPFSTATDDDDDRTTTAKSTTAATSRKPASTTHTTETEAMATSTAKSTKDQSTLMVATKSPSASNSASLVGALVSATASATASISATPTSGATESGGMSGGAKAGLALGILLGVAALLAGILFIYRRKKNAMAGEKDNEKIGMHDAPAPLPPQVPIGAAAAAPSIRTQRTMSTAPRLSLRPVTQFDPTFNEQRKSGGNLLTVAAAAAPVSSQDRAAQSEDLPVSAWERRGAANAANDNAPATNPFSDPQTPANNQAPANPFGNSAAIDAAHAAIPDSPPQGTPMHSATPSADLAARVAPEPAPAPASKDDAVAVATAISSVPVSDTEFPTPPSMNPEGVPASPAWTEDVPSSPAMGTPMIAVAAGAAGAAGAMAAGRPNGAPGPNNVHRVQLDFKPSMQDELELKAGGLVRMLHEYDDGWALCISMDRTQQGVVPRTCLSKHPVKPRTGPPRQGPPPPHMRGPPIRSPMGPGGVPQPRPMSPADGRSSPHPPALSPANGRMSPGPRAMSPGPRQMPPPHMQGPPRNRAHSNAPYPGSPQGRGRANSNAPYAGPPRSMSPGPYGGGPMAPPPQMGRPRSNSAGQVNRPRGPAPGPSPMNPNAGPVPAPLTSAVPSRKPVPGMAL